MPAKKKATAKKKVKPASGTGGAKSEPVKKKAPAVEFKIVQTVEQGPDSNGKGLVGDRMAAEAGQLVAQGWDLVSVHRSESSHFDHPFLVGVFRRERKEPTGGKRAQAKPKVSFKCKEYRPDPDPSKARKFLSSIYADASKMAEKGSVLACFFLTADGAMTGIYRSQARR